MNNCFYTHEYHYEYVMSHLFNKKKKSTDLCENSKTNVINLFLYFIVMKYHYQNWICQSTKVYYTETLLHYTTFTSPFLPCRNTGFLFPTVLQCRILVSYCSLVQASCLSAQCFRSSCTEMVQRWCHADHGFTTGGQGLLPTARFTLNGSSWGIIWSTRSG
jgi:hypothetical protein